MRLHKTTALLIVITAAVMVTTALTTLRSEGNSLPYDRAQSQNEQEQEEQYRRRKERESRFPSVDFEAPEPDEPGERAKRKLKNGRYDKTGFAIADDSPRIGEESVITDWEVHVKAIPTAQSDSVVVGEVLSAEAHLSNNKAGVYTEFTVRVIEAMKVGSSRPTAPAGLIEVDRLGGFVRYRNGHKRLYNVEGQNMPEVGRRYVLFLTADEKSPNYRLLTGYELRGGRVAPLDDSRSMNAYEGVDETTFLNTVRDDAARPQ